MAAGDAARIRQRLPRDYFHLLLQLNAVERPCALPVNKLNMENIVYILLLLTSIIGLTFIVERGLALRWRKVVPPDIEAAVESCESHEDVAMLRRLCQQHASPLSRLLTLAADHLDWPKADNED